MSGKTYSRSTAGISICCSNLYTIMTSARVHAISLLCTKRDAETYDKRKSFDSVCICLTAQTVSRMDEWACCYVIRQPRTSNNHMGPFDTESEQSQQSDYYLYEEMTLRLELQYFQYIQWNSLDREDRFQNHSSWQAFIPENKWGLINFYKHFITQGA